MKSEFTQRVSLFQAILLGLGSIVGTGVFISIAIAAGVAGSGVVLATILAGLVATCNGLSSAQLAANHPVNGGTYEYGYRWVSPPIGFVAGWMFLCAKSASAATAALGFSIYFASALQLQDYRYIQSIAVFTVLLLTGLILRGIKSSAQINTLCVAVALFSLITFCLFAFLNHGEASASALATFSTISLLEATALMFVAFTGYGRIATLGEEVEHPSRTIPKAIIFTIFLSIALYIAVALALTMSLPHEFFRDFAGKGIPPLAHAANILSGPSLRTLVTVGAALSMIAVLLNLILGLSRMVLALARREDLPSQLSAVNESGTAPIPATLLTGAVIVLIILLFDIKQSWSFSAFTVLIYYSITNLSALRMSKDERLYPRVIPLFGLISSLSLAFWVDRQALLTGSTLLFIGLIYRQIRHRLRSRF